MKIAKRVYWIAALPTSLMLVNVPDQATRHHVSVIAPARGVAYWEVSPVTAVGVSGDARHPSSGKAQGLTAAASTAGIGTSKPLPRI